jgi:hypothetical protein
MIQQLKSKIENLKSAEGAPSQKPKDPNLKCENGEES